MTNLHELINKTLSEYKELTNDERDIIVEAVILSYYKSTQDESMVR